MNLTTETMLQGVGETLRARIFPAIQDPYAAEMGRLAAMVLSICTNWVDDAAELRVQENAELRVLFSDVAGIVADKDLSERLDRAGTGANPSLKVSELDRENGRLRVLLVELHAHVEAGEGGEARVINQRIWRLLESIEARRAPRS